LWEGGSTDRLLVLVGPSPFQFLTDRSVYSF